MQPEPHWQERTVNRFLQRSRLYLGLIQPSVTLNLPKRLAGSGRHVLRSLVVAGSLSALVGSPAFATETGRAGESGKRQQNTFSSRANSDTSSVHPKAIPIPGKRR